MGAASISVVVHPSGACDTQLFRAGQVFGECQQTNGHSFNELYACDAGGGPVRLGIHKNYAPRHAQWSAVALRLYISKGLLWRTDRITYVILYEFRDVMKQRRGFDCLTR